MVAYKKTKPPARISPSFSRPYPKSLLYLDYPQTDPILSKCRSYMLGSTRLCSPCIVYADENFTRNLSWSTTDDSLRQGFEEYGTVEEAVS
jgi:hypothetical protein